MLVGHEQFAEVAVLHGWKRLAARQRHVGSRGCPGTDGRRLFGEAFHRREVREGDIPPVCVHVMVSIGQRRACRLELVYAVLTIVGILAAVPLGTPGARFAS
eukprot:5231491-Pyramimonas_sp.AAC.1